MNAEVFRRVIIDYQTGDFPPLTRRDLDFSFIPNMALGIVGTRRGGKTFRTHQLVSDQGGGNSLENVCRVQFNDHRYAGISSESLHAIDDAYYSLYPEKRNSANVLFIFDEIHRIPGWEDYILYLLESQKHKVVVTGSTASLIRGQFASQLRGKIFPVELFPFSFREFIRHYNIKEDLLSSAGRSFLQNNFQKYLKQGGFPGLLDIPDHLHADLLRTYWDTMLLRDIIEAHSNENINISVLRYFADALVTRVGCPMTTSKIATNMKNLGLAFSHETLYKYLSYLADAYMIDTVEIFSESEKVRARNYKKVYCIDWALAEAVSHGAGTDPTRALENMVYIELKRRGGNIHYFRTHDGAEVDFVVKNNKNQIHLIQVAYSMASDEVRKREIRVLEATFQYLGAKSMTVITANEEQKINANTSGVQIQVIPAWKWLLSPSLS